MVAKTQIERLREPSLKLVDYVTMEMTVIAREVVMKVTRTLSLSWLEEKCWVGSRCSLH